MITKNDIEKLASLGRVKLVESEKESFATEIDAILGYVGEIQKVTASDVQVATHSELVYPHRNIMREDSPRTIDAKKETASGKYSEDLLTSSPDRDGQYIKVKKILG
ncbi:MAG: Asp-tRNA(Asn)/Glu-tRNA(Gln) amidotransferase subunit GatC [Candidatus Pacebacteria bacterium]|nr:Asp-tRNA(Asn)/Glu-tRNA(Gln) amidotransferase subunit GatC [Candidatus Paceibacterota bacterium]